MTDDKIKKYFLGELTETEANGFEEDFAQNAELTEQAKLVESEIIDAYLRDEFSESERLLFEANYLTTEARREKLRFAQIFLSSFKQQSKAVIEKKSIWLTIFSRHQFPRLVFAGIVTILLLGGFIFVLLNRQDKPEFARQQNTNQTPTPKNDNQNNPPISNTNIINQNLNANSVSANATNQNSADTKKPTPTPAIKTTPTPKTIEQSAPTLASFVLFPGTLRSEGEQFIKVLANTNKINLRLKLPKDANKYQTYTATIKTADGETVFTSPNLKSLNLTLPAIKLENRTYIIFLEGQNAQNQPAESITEYTFSVRR